MTMRNTSRPACHTPSCRPTASGTPGRGVVLTAVLAIGVWTATVPAAELRLRSECRCPGPVVTLGDVADVLTADADEAERLASLELFPTPAPGIKRYLRPRQIQDLLLIRGVSLLEHRISGASQIVLLSDRAEAETGDLRESSVSANAGAERPVAPPACVVFVAKSLPRGALICAADVRLEQGQLIDEAGDAFPAIDEVVGQQTTRAIPAGTLLDRSCIRPPLLVRRGEVITVYARSAGIQVRTAAKARQEGSLGDLIQIESLTDRAAYLARVCGVQEVEVYARATRADRAATTDSDRTRR